MKFGNKINIIIRKNKWYKKTAKNFRNKKYSYLIKTSLE